MSRPEIRIPSLSQFGTPRSQAMAIGGGLLVLLLIWIAVSSIYTIEPEEAGLVLRFGKYQRTTLPGLHSNSPPRWSG